MNLQKLRNYLLSSCRYSQTKAGVLSPDDSALWVEWVVARSLCVFRSVDISSVSAAELDAFLRMQVREWAPFDDPEYHFQTFGNRALVWAWDGELRRSRCRECGVTPDAILPESVMRSPGTEPGDAKVQLVACIEGFEGRGFRESRQVQSRWWAEHPSLKSWNQFRMLFDLPPVESVPEPAESSLASFAAAPLKSMLLPFLRAESTLFVLFFALFLVAASYQLAGIAYASVAVGAAEADIAELNQAVTPVLSARDEALAALDDIESMTSLRAGPLQLQYLSDLLDHLARARAEGREVHLMAWEFQSEGIAISVTAEELSAAELLTLFEGVPWLVKQRVGDDRVKGRMRITAELAPGWRFTDADDEQVAGT